MSLAVVIDATDGTLARAARVKEIIPWFDGDRLEDIIDYANYVIVPCWFFIHANLLPVGRRAMACQPAVARERLWFLPEGSKDQRQFFSRLSLVLEYHCVLFVRLAIATLDQCLHNSLSLSSRFRSNQVHLPKSKPSLSLLDEYSRKPLGSGDTDNYLFAS